MPAGATMPKPTADDYATGQGLDTAVSVRSTAKGEQSQVNALTGEASSRLPSQLAISALLPEASVPELQWIAQHVHDPSQPTPTC